MKRSVILGFLAIVILFSNLCEVNAYSWKYLGSRTVSSKIDHDKILVTGFRGEFKQIKIRVSRSAVRFYRVVVTYRNGSKQQFNLPTYVRAGGETRALNLRGKSRVIRNVEFWYRATLLGKKTAVVSLYGND